MNTSLVNNGEQEAAESLAAKHDSNTGALIEQAPLLIAQTRRELFGEVEELAR